MACRTYLESPDTRLDALDDLDRFLVLAFSIYFKIQTNNLSDKGDDSHFKFSTFARKKNE